MQLQTIGWREWMALPELGIPMIKAKVDSGARTSCLHAFSIRPYTDKGVKRVRFKIHPLQRRSDIVRECDTPIIDRRYVTDSGGHHELRYVIESTLSFMGERWPVEITLKDRETMLFRMLLGRTAMRGRFIVDPAVSFAAGIKTPDEAAHFYTS